VITAATLAVALHVSIWIPCVPAAGEEARQAGAQSTATPQKATPEKATPDKSTPDKAAPDKATFKQEELDQMLAPIALYPDALLTQVLMASTYPLEIVEADRWVKANKSLKGDAQAKALEKQKWDPSVKSLIDFGTVLEMLSTKLDWTQKLGDAFIGQQKQVMETIQKLRGKAKENGKLESSKDLKVETKPGDPTEIITIESTSPTVIYVPSYDPVVVYGYWPYPAYPPYPYYPPGYVAGAAFCTFAVGVAWGYAWGNCNWGGGDVDIDINRNTEFNRNIDRGKYKDTARGDGGKWKHDASHRGNVPYRDNATAKNYGGKSASDAAKARSDYRGRAEAGRADLSRGAADQYKGAGGARNAGAASGRDAGAASGRGANSGAGRTGSGGASGSRPASTGKASSRGGGGLSGVSGGGAAARSQSARGSASRGGGGGRGGGGRR
jgi:hypothetical protein